MSFNAGSRSERRAFLRTKTAYLALAKLSRSTKSVAQLQIDSASPFDRLHRTWCSQIQDGTFNGFLAGTQPGNTARIDGCTLAAISVAESRRVPAQAF
jgi:hypothetical protein